MSESRRSRASRRRSPRSMGAILQEVAAAAGESRLEKVAMELAVRRAMGSYLSRRLVACRREGDMLVLEMTDAAVVGEVRALAAEILKGLARAGGDVPRFIRAAVSASGAARRAGLSLPCKDSASPVRRQLGPQAEGALDGLSDPVLRRKLSRWIRSAPASTSRA